MIWERVASRKLAWNFRDLLPHLPPSLRLTPFMGLPFTDAPPSFTDSPPFTVPSESSCPQVIRVYLNSLNPPNSPSFLHHPPSTLSTTTSFFFFLQHLLSTLSTTISSSLSFKHCTIYTEITCSILDII